MLRALVCLCAVVLPSFSSVAARAHAFHPDVAPAGIVSTVAADCYSVGQKIAAREGGDLIKSTPDKRGGKTVCVVIVVVPPTKKGDHPRRAEFVEPQ